MTLSTDLFTGLTSFLLTLFILSYLIKDNPLFRIATFLFVGVTSGYISALAWWQILWPNLVQPLMFGSLETRVLLLPPLLASGFLLMKIWPRLGFLGTPVLAYLVGVSAATAIGGALIGTLSPQIWATIYAFDLRSPAQNSNWLQVLWNGGFVLIGTVTSLAFFHFSARNGADGSAQRAVWIEWLAFAGRIFIAIALGVIFAGVYMASLTSLIERISFIIQFLM